MSGIALFSGPFFGSAFYYIGSFTPIGGFSTPMYALSLIYLLTIPLLVKGLKYEVSINVNLSGKGPSCFFVGLGRPRRNHILATRINSSISEGRNIIEEGKEKFTV